MSTVEEIKVAIEALPKADYSRLREWFVQNDWTKWDKQIESDSSSLFILRELRALRGKICE